MHRILVVLAASVLLFALPASTDAARSCKKKRESRGCVVKNAKWGEGSTFSPTSTAEVTVLGREIGHNVTMTPGTPSGNYPSAPKRCAVEMSTNRAVLFGSGPRIKKTIRIGRTYTGRSTFSVKRGEPGFRDPGGAFGGDASVQSLAATYNLKVKIVSARKARVTASGTNTAEVLYRDPNSPDSDPKYIPGRFTCTASYTGTIKRTY
ncbi:MAG TPA: hypothetical protein VF587_13390 [Solirubrobacteraceae bacterium]|jgi:hypothetical protein